jgi:hypothetical protein
MPKMAVPPQAAMGKEEMYARVDRLTHLILSTENLGENLTKTQKRKMATRIQERQAIQDAIAQAAFGQPVSTRVEM